MAVLSEKDTHKTLSNSTRQAGLPIDIEAALTQYYAPYRRWPAVLRIFVSWVLCVIIRQDRLNSFLSENSHLGPFEFIDAVFDELKVGYQFTKQDIENIPAKGGVIIIANHPLGALDGLGLLRLVSQVRQDVKIVANQLLGTVTPLAPLLLPVNNMGSDSRKQDLANIARALEEEQAVIFFPAGEVSRLSPQGIRDRKWDAGFLRFATRRRVPILPVYIRARNSGLFYTVARFSSVLSMVLLPREMMQFSGTIRFVTSPVIGPEQITNLSLARAQKVKLLRKHLYQIPTRKKPVFTPKASIIRPQDRSALKAELEAGEELGRTFDHKRILLCSCKDDSVVLEELGRLREEAFRAVGEGTGKSKDVDFFDRYYRHIIVWDEECAEIAGAYRLGEIWKWHQDNPHKTSQQLCAELYSSQLFTLNGEIEQVMPAALELGRSFVQPRFWGKRSLDYLWQGIGAYVARHPDVRYLFGAVSVSASLPERSRELLVWHYQRHYPQTQLIAQPKAPFHLSLTSREKLSALMPGIDKEADFNVMREQFSHMQVRVPTLYRQYSELCHSGGVSFSAFNVDAEFAMCLDSLVSVDLQAIKPNKYARYVQPYLGKVPS